MTIGINAAAAVKQPRTGVEEYTYQLIKHLTMLPEARAHRFLLYVPDWSVRKNPPQPSLKGGSTPPLGGAGGDLFDFPLPANFIIKELKWPLPFLWTQLRLAWEVLRWPPEILFIPVHVLPFGAPKNSVVTIHGLEYEYFPEYYPWLHRWYLHWSTKRAVRRAAKIIAISECTKNDLVKLYNVSAGKIEVVQHGVSFCHSGLDLESRGSGSRIKCGTTIIEKPFILYIGRIETKKNIHGLLAAYKILKEKYGVPHQLVLAGSPGYGYENFKFEIDNSLKIENCKLKIEELGYVDEGVKWQLFSGADIFLFPSFYEGFGLPVLEAQISGVPVVCSDGFSLREIAGQGALFVNPQNSAQIAEAIKRVIDDSVLRDRLRQSGKENIKRFSWEQCAKETLRMLIK